MWLDELRRMKDERGLTTREISLSSDIPEPTLEKIFSGATRDPKLATMQQLVHTLGYSLDDLSPNNNKKALAITLEPNTEDYKFFTDFKASSKPDQSALMRFASLAAAASPRSLPLSDNELGRETDDWISQQVGSQKDTLVTGQKQQTDSL